MLLPSTRQCPNASLKQQKEKMPVHAFKIKRLQRSKILRKCKGTDEAKAAAKARTACLKQIVACKNASTQAATLQYACSYSKEKLMKTLKQLTENKAAFKALLDKVKELTGLSPNMSMPRKNKRSDEETEEDSILDLQNRQRGKRQATVVECSEVTTSITTCTTTITNKPASKEVTVKCKAMSYTIKECTADDKKNIQKALDESLGKNGIIIAFIDSVKNELKEMTGTTPSDAEVGNVGNTAKASARSRSILRKLIMDKMQLN